MDEDSECSSITGIHHPRLDFSRHGFQDYSSGLNPHPHPHHHPHHPHQQHHQQQQNHAGPFPIRYPDLWSQGQKSHMYSTSGSSPSTFEEVESLCMSRSSNDSSLFRQQMRNLPTRAAGSHGLGPHQGPFLNGKYLSRQSSGTSTSTSSGNLPEPAAERQFRATGAGVVGGSPYESGHADGSDPRQHFNFNEHALLDGMFRRVLEWNQVYATAMGRGGGAPSGFAQRSPSSVRFSPGRFPSVPPGSFPPGGFCQLSGEGLRSRSSSPMPVSPGTGSAQPASAPASAGRRVPDLSKEKTMSPTSDITHVKKRRDLILPDEEDEFSFSRPSNHKPEVEASTKTVHTHSGHSTHTPSSLKQASSESMLSSMSSMSQSQDMGWREQFNHDWREAQHAIWREQADQGFGDPYVNPWRRSDPSQQMWREPPMFFHPPPPPPPSAMMMPPPYHMSARGLHRGMSIESMTSLGIVSPPESYTSSYGPNSQNPAEMMLMNLGFGGSAEGFLPERFLRDWYSKISRTHGQFPMNLPRPSESGSSPYDNTFSPHSNHSSRVPLPPKPNYEDLRSASDLHRRIAQPFNQAVLMAAAQGSDAPETPTSLLPPSLGKDSRTDRLKEYIEAYAQNLSNTTDARSVKIRQFACSRQKSLPSYLETLTEEEEVKSRNTWQKPQDGECRLQAFLREDSLSTASGQSESQCTSSGGGSNDHSLMGSESDSLSGSDHVDYNQRMNPRHGVPCEQTNCAPYPQPVPIASRVLKLKMPNPAERRARLKSESRNVNDEEDPHVSENQCQARSLINMAGLASENTEDKSLIPHTQHTFNPDREARGLGRPKSPKAARSPKKKPHLGSPNRRTKSSCLIKTKSAMSADSILITNAERPSNTATERNSHGNITSNCIDRNKLFVSQIPMESPIRRCYNPQYNPNLQTDSYHFQNMLTTPAAHDIHNNHDTLPDQSCDGDLKHATFDSHLSTESLEVADIFHKSGQTSTTQFKDQPRSQFESSAWTRGEGLLEPAMVSIVLEDVDGNLMDNADSCDGHSGHRQSHQRQGDGVHQDDFLQIPSCSSSTSLSPVPLSPVTVIEVGLDNQQDSLDTEDSAGSSKDQNDNEDDPCDFKDQTHEQGCDCSPKSTTDDSEFSRVKEHVSENECSQSVFLSCGRSMKSRCEENRIQSDACVDADDGSVSPVLLFSAVSPDTSSSSSPSVTALDSKLSDVGVQADDGLLSPLMFLNQDDLLSDLIRNDCAEDLYLVSDQTTQCDGEDLPYISGTHERNSVGPLLQEIPADQEMAVIQMRDTGCQTRHQVTYEMSSQTDSTHATAAERLHLSDSSRRKMKPNSIYVPSHNLLSLKDLSLFYKNSVSSGISFKQADFSFTQPRSEVRHNRRSLESPKSQSFDSEFWEYMGMEIPQILRRSEAPSTPVENQAQAVSSFSAKTNSHVSGHVTKSGGYAESVNKENESPGLSDSHEVVRSLASYKPASSQSPSDALNCQSRHTQEHSSAFPPKCSVAASEAKPHQQKHVHCPLKHLQLHLQVSKDSSSSESAPELSSFFPATPAERENFTTHKYFYMANTENPDAKLPGFGLSTIVQGLPKSAVEQTCARNMREMHVSQLNFEVSDYRATSRGSYINSNELDPNFNKHATTTVIQNTNTTECASKVITSISEPSVVSQTKSLKLSNAESRKIEEKSHSSQNSKSVEEVCSVRTQSMDASVTNHVKEADPDMDSGIIDSPTSSCLLSHDEEQSTAEQSQEKDLNLLMRGTSIDDFCDKNFKSTEEAREFVLSRFLLRGSTDSNTVKVNNPGTLSESSKLQNTRSGCLERELDKKASSAVEHKTNDTLQNMADQNALDKLMYKSLIECQSSEAANGFLEETTKERKLEAGHLSKVAGSIERHREKLEQSSHMEQAAMRNLALDCFLLREQTKENPDIAKRHKVVSKTQKDAHTYTSVDVIEDRNLGHAEDAETDMENISGMLAETKRSEGSNELADLESQGCLVDMFVSSVLQSACEDLQRSYQEDKERLQNRLKSQLKLTGMFSSEEDQSEVSVPPLQEETGTVGLKHKTFSTSTPSQERNSASNTDAAEEQTSLSPFTAALVGPDICNQKSQDPQDSMSDASSDFTGSVVSQPVCSEADHQTDGKDFFTPHMQRDSVETSLVASQTAESVEQEARLSPWQGYGFHAFSSRLDDMDTPLRSCLSPSRSQSADSIDSLRANCSGSIDDVLDAVDEGGEVIVLQSRYTGDTSSFWVFSEGFDYSHEDYSQHSSSAMIAEDISSSVQSDSDGPSGVVELPAESIHYRDAHKKTVSESLSSSSCDAFTENRDSHSFANTADKCLEQHPAESQPTLVEERKMHRGSSTGSSEITSSEDLLTDAKLTQLILLGDRHPEFQRLKEQGILSDSFESSPSFTTPDNEISSDAEDQGLEEPSGAFPLTPEDLQSISQLHSVLDSHVSWHAHTEFRCDSDLPNIPEETDVSEVYAVTDAEARTCDSTDGTDTCHDCKDVLDLDPSGHTVEKMPKETERCSQKPDMEVTLQPLPREFHVRNLAQYSLSDDEVEPEQFRSDHRSKDNSRVFTFDMDNNDLNRSLLWPGRSEEADVVSVQRQALSPLPDAEEENPASPELCALNSSVGLINNNSTNMDFNDCYYRPISVTTSTESDQFPGDATDSVSSEDVHYNFPPLASSDAKEHPLPDDQSVFVSLSGDISTNIISEDHRRQIRSQLYLSLHPMQSESFEKMDVPEPSKVLSAAQRREAYNKVTADRTGFGISTSFSEENLSSPPLRPRRFQRSLSKESSSSELSPKRTKRTVNRSSPNFNTGQTYSGNSLQVPNMGESLVSKNTLTKRNRSSPGGENSSRPSCQSPVPGDRVPSRSNTPGVSRSNSPTLVGRMPDVLLSPHQNSPSSRAPSPIPDVTISSVNQSLEVISFASSPEASSRETSPPCDHPLQSPCRSPGRIKTTVFENSQTDIKKDANAPSSPGYETVFTANHPERLSPYRYIESSSPKHRSPRLSKFRALQKFGTVSSPDGSPEQMMPSIFRSHSSSGDEAGPVQIPVSRTFYSSKHTQLLQPRARLWAMGDRNSSSTESPMPSTPPLSRDPSSTSESSSSHKDSQSVTSVGMPASTCLSPKSPTAEPPQRSPDPPVETRSPQIIPSVSSAFEGDDRKPITVSAIVCSEEIEASEQQPISPPGLDKSPVHSTPDPVPANSGPPSPAAASPEPDPLKALHLRRSRFQKPENTISLQQNSSSSEQSSFETSTSPCRRFFWASGQKTVVSTETFFQEKAAAEHIPHRVRSTWTSNDLPRTSAQSDSKHRNAGNKASTPRDSSSSGSDHMSSDGSPAHSRMSSHDDLGNSGSVQTPGRVGVDGCLGSGEKARVLTKSGRKDSTRKNARQLAQ